MIVVIVLSLGQCCRLSRERCGRVAIASLLPQLPLNLKNTFLGSFKISLGCFFFFVVFLWKLASPEDLDLDMVLRYFLLF